MLTKEERILIGKRIVEGEITVHDAEKEYHISRSSAQQYATIYFSLTSARSISSRPWPL